MIKKILRTIILLSLAIFLAGQIWQNLNYSNSLSIVLKAAIFLTIFEFLIKPILKLLLLPITIITLGLIKLLINTLGLYIVEYFINDFQVQNIDLSDLVWFGYHLPNIQLNFFWAHLVTSLTINIVYNWLSKILVKVKKISV